MKTLLFVLLFSSLISSSNEKDISILSKIKINKKILNIKKSEKLNSKSQVGSMYKVSRIGCWEICSLDII